MQPYFIVVGGELADVSGTEFRDTNAVHLVGVFTSEEQAKAQWKANAQRTVDNALMRYFVVPFSLTK